MMHAMSSSRHHIFVKAMVQLGRRRPAALVAAATCMICSRSTEGFGFHAGDGIGRRSFLATGVSTILASPVVTNALDMDAFASSQLSADAPKKDLSDDEALCKFGAPGKQRGEACQRAGIKTASSDKNKVDAFGNVDRGDFVRCNREWRVVDGKYQKFDICK